MALKYADRIKESAAAPGTGNLTLGGAVTGGFFPFSSFMANGDQTYYGIVDNQGAAEVGLGTWTTGGVFVRNVVYASTNSGSAVNFTNPVQIYCDAPASRLPLLDTSGKLPAVDGSALTNLNASALASGVVAAARGGAGSNTGILKANGSGVVSPAVSNTDYAPPTIVSSSGPSGSGVPGQLWVVV